MLTNRLLRASYRDDARRLASQPISGVVASPKLYRMEARRVGAYLARIRADAAPSTVRKYERTLADLLALTIQSRRHFAQRRRMT